MRAAAGGVLASGQKALEISADNNSIAVQANSFREEV
jgi:hypothetical protein